MMDTYNHSHFVSLGRARQIIGGVTLLLALALAGPPRLWGQCDPATMPFPTVTVGPSSILGDSTQTSTATVTVSNIGNGGVSIPIWAGGLTLVGNIWLGELVIPAGSNQGTFTIIPEFDVAQSTTINITASDGPCGSSAPLTITPNAPTLSLSPSSVIGGTGATITATATMTGAVDGVTNLSITNPGLQLSGPELWFGDLVIPAGSPVGQFTITPYAVTVPRTCEKMPGHRLSRIRADEKSR